MRYSIYILFIQWALFYLFGNYALQYSKLKVRPSNSRKQPNAYHVGRSHAFVTFSIHVLQPTVK